MTANRDLKRRVRDRQAHTGESYMTALNHILAQRPASAIPSAIPTVEFLDVSTVAAALGLKCQVSLSPLLAHAIDVEATLERLCETLAATQHDPALAILRTIAVHGQQVASPAQLGFQEVRDALLFVRRLRAGIGGISDNGRMLGLRAVARAAPGESPAGSDPRASDRLVLISPWTIPSFAVVDRPPLLIITSLEETVPDAVFDRFGIEGKIP
jgi:hypothetical protein